MRSAKSIICVLAFVVAAPVARGTDKEPAEELARLKKQLEKAYTDAWEVGRKTAMSEAERSAADDRYSREAVLLGRRALRWPSAPRHPRGTRGTDLGRKHRRLLRGRRVGKGRGL